MNTESKLDDAVINHVLSNPETYSVSFVDYCKKEKSRRQALSVKDGNKLNDFEKIINEQPENERRDKLMVWWRKWKLCVIACGVVILAILGNTYSNRKVIQQYHNYYDVIVVQKKQFNADSSTIAMIESACDNVIDKMLISRKHKGNAYHLKAYLKGNGSKPDADLLYQAKELNSPLAIVETAMQIMFEIGDFFTVDDVKRAIEKLDDLNTVEADIILAANEFMKSNYNAAYELLSKNIKTSTLRFKTDHHYMEYDESDCITTLGYNMLGILYYYGNGGAKQSAKLAKHYLNYNGLMKSFSADELADYKPTVRYSYFNSIIAETYNIIGDFLFMAHNHYMYRKTYASDDYVLKYICGSYNFYSAASHLDSDVIGLTDKLGITGKIYERCSKRNSGWRTKSYSGNYYILDNKNWGIGFTANKSEEIKYLTIGQFVRSNARSRLYESYKRRGTCLLVEDDLAKDTYKVYLKTF